MKGHLSVHDVSAYVHTGMNSDRYKGFTQQNFPLGGVKYLMKYITLHLVDRMDIALAFDSRSFRKDLLHGYKGSRGGGKHSISSQLALAYDLLLEANVACYKVDGYEADDLIHSIVEDNRSNYYKLTVVSSDYDITHNVDEQCYFEAVNDNVNNVSYMNFKDNVVRGKKIWLNTISAFKTFHGCSSDGIPAFNSRAGISNDELYNKFYEYLCTMSSYNVKVSRHPKAFELFLQKMSDTLPSEDIEELSLRAKVVYPAKVEGTFTGSGKNTIDMYKFGRILMYCGDYASLKTLGLQTHSLTDREKEMFRQKARELTTGEFAVDNNLPVQNDLAEFEFMDMREF